MQTEKKTELTNQLKPLARRAYQHWWDGCFCTMESTKKPSVLHFIASDTVKLFGLHHTSIVSKPHCSARAFLPGIL